MSQEKKETDPDTDQGVIECVKRNNKIIIKRGCKEYTCCTQGQESNCTKLVGGVWKCKNTLTTHFTCASCIWSRKDKQLESGNEGPPTCQCGNPVEYDEKISGIIEQHQVNCPAYTACGNVFLSAEELNKHTAVCDYIDKCLVCGCCVCGTDEMKGHIQEKHPDIHVSTTGVVDFGEGVENGFVFVMNKCNETLSAFVQKIPGKGIFSVRVINGTRLEDTPECKITVELVGKTPKNKNRPAIEVTGDTSKLKTFRTSHPLVNQSPQLTRATTSYKLPEEGFCVFFPEMSPLMNMFNETGDYSSHLFVNYTTGLVNVKLTGRFFVKKGSCGENPDNIVFAIVLGLKAPWQENVVDLNDIIIEKPMRPRSILDTMAILNMPAEKIKKRGYVVYS